MTYIAVGIVIKSTHPRIEVGKVIATEMRKTYSKKEPYPMILMVDDTLVVVTVMWKEFVKVNSKTPKEEKDRIMRELIDKWSKQKNLLGIFKAMNQMANDYTKIRKPTGSVPNG